MPGAPAMVHDLRQVAPATTALRRKAGRPQRPRAQTRTF